VTAVPRPTTKLTDEQQQLLDEAVEAATKKHDAQRETDAMEEAAWDRILRARRAGVPDELLCDRTGFSRATLNRKYGTRRIVDE
jgi:hypothetical protein